MQLSRHVGEFLALASIHFLAVVAPGPDFAVTVSQSVRFGRRSGIFTALGIGSGISVHVLYTLAGIGALMHANEQLLALARLAGGAYLVHLAVQLLRARRHSALPGETLQRDAAAAPSNARAFLTGFLTNATNPKATLFFLSIFTAVVNPETPLALQSLYGFWMCTVNALWFCLVALFFSHGAIRLRFVEFGHWFERAMGLILLAFAARLLLSILD
ncbi:LysE family translocator [Caldimonas tepidiphila]|uniref:LysE family translocator n=1 Tax=Caldimonas tepidiphila TaxID=2315841 RepID=UPI000E5BDBD0|nr:LysE family transporter [Caldimonas tepidiphila]